MAEHHDNEIVLEVEGVTKQFPGVLANDNVSLQLRRGEILALLGENGAGKSTLMNIIYGLYHADKGTIRLKGHEVHFASPREAIRSGIGMVHQHFQLVDVMTVAENVVLGEESTVAYQGENAPLLRWVLRWLPSLLVFALSVIVGFSLGGLSYMLGGMVVGAALATLVAHPPWARLTWGLVWRVGLALLALSIAGQVETVTRVGLTDIALRQEVAIHKEKKPKTMDAGYTVKRAVVKHQRVPFSWSKEYRDATTAGTGIEGVIARAKEEMSPYRDNGIPGWLLDAIDDVPPVAHALSVAIFLLLLGAHSVHSWRGERTAPGRWRPHDLALVGGLLAVYVGMGWQGLSAANVPWRVALSVLLSAGLVWIAWQTYRHRQQRGDVLWRPSPLDSVVDAFLNFITDLTEIGNMRAAAERVREFSRQYGLEVDPDAVVEKLPVGMQQRVEIIKALYRQADILILDEPTAVLTPQEGRELFKIMRQLSAQGVSIIFITHKLKEVFEVATHIVVMRGGRVVGTTTPDQATETSLAAMMVGREVILKVEKDEAHPTEPVLEVDGLNALDDRGAQALKDVSFQVRAGEVLGIAGVQGNGQTELVEVLTGLRTPTGGAVRLLGMELQPDEQPDGRLWPRLAALVLDMALVALMAYFVGFFVWYFRDGRLGIASAVVVTLLVDALYFLGSWAGTGATLGMAVFGLEVSETESDTRPNALRLLRRYLAFTALRLPLFAPLLVAFQRARRTGKTRCWHDTFAGVRIIKRERITPRRIKDVGTSHVPEDRLRHGLVKLYSVADNLILNDYYERPFAKAPNLAQLPGALLRYVVVTGAVIAALTVVALYVWDHWLWEALLDAYRVPDAMRSFSTSLSKDQKAALQYPLLISIIALLVAEMLFGVLAHVVAVWVLGQKRVRAFYQGVGAWFQRLAWRAAGQAGNPAPPKGGLLRDEHAIMQHARDLIREFDIRTPGPETPGGTLSGGNQQKLIVAREFSRKPRLLIAAQPTRGIDVGSIEFIHNQIIEQRDAGAAVLLVSAELDEIMALADRIAVLYKGEVIDTLPAEAATREQLGLLMAGIRNG